MSEITDCPLLPLRETVLFPRLNRHLMVGREASKKSVQHAFETGAPLFAVTEAEDGAFMSVGTLARVKRITPSVDGVLLLVELEASVRARLERVVPSEAFPRAEVAPEASVGAAALRPKMEATRGLALEICDLYLTALERQGREADRPRGDATRAGRAEIERLDDPTVFSDVLPRYRWLGDPLRPDLKSFATSNAGSRLEAESALLERHRDRLVARPDEVLAVLRLLTSRGLRSGLPKEDRTGFRAVLAPFSWSGEEMMFRSRDAEIEGEAVRVAVFMGDPDGEEIEQAARRCTELLPDTAADAYDNVIVNTAAAQLEPGFQEAPRLRAFLSWARDNLLDASELA